MAYSVHFIVAIYVKRNVPLALYQLKLAYHGYICLMKKSSLLFTALILVGIGPAHAQDHPTCDNQRYRLDVFENVKVTGEIEYSEAETIGGETVKLYMDIYEPEGDLATERPVVVLAFGGSFIGGSRQDIAPLCERFAQKGYVAVSIDYRLYDLPLIPFPTEEEMQDVVVRAIKDMKTALRFLDDDAKADNTYGIDMNWLYVGGISAGGIAANHTAMLDSTDVFSPAIASALATHSPIYGITDTDTSIRIRGVLNYSGALHDASWLDAGDPPFISFHDDGDETVPYKSGFAQVFGQDIIFLNGSYIMDSVANAVGVRSELNTILADGHVTYFFDEDVTTEVINKSAGFMYNMICSETADIKEVDLIKPYTFGPNPTAGSILLEINGEAKAILHDLAGRVLSTQTIVNSGSLNLQEFASGNYILKIEVGEKVYTEKVVKE